MRKIEFAAFLTVLIMLVSAYAALAVDPPAPTFCEIVNVTAPIFAETGEGIEIDIRYTNLGEDGQTFLRVISPIGNLYNYAEEANHQTNDATKGIHIYQTMPAENMVYQVEVGTGSFREPDEITDVDLLIVLNPEYPPPDMNTVEVKFNTIYPILMYPWTVEVGGYPGRGKR